MNLLGSIFGREDTADKPKLRGMVIVGFVIVGLFFGIFGGWALLAPLESAAIAPGVVSIDTNRKTVQHLEGASLVKSACAKAIPSKPGRF